jgi:hypothetical protein
MLTILDHREQYVLLKVKNTDASSSTAIDNLIIKYKGFGCFKLGIQDNINDQILIGSFIGRTQAQQY